jgi:hypothetical protein
VTPEAAAFVLQTTLRRVDGNFWCWIWLQLQDARLGQKRLGIQRQFLALQLNIVNIYVKRGIAVLLTRWEYVSSVSGQKNSIDGEFVASSCRKGERPRPQNIDAVGRKGDT